MDATGSDPLCGGHISGSSESDRSGGFCERCPGRSTDRCRIGHFMFLGDLGEKVTDYENRKRKRCFDSTGTDRVIF